MSTLGGVFGIGGACDGDRGGIDGGRGSGDALADAFATLAIGGPSCAGTMGAGGTEAGDAAGGGCDSPEREPARR